MSDNIEETTRCDARLGSHWSALACPHTTKLEIGPYMMPSAPPWTINDLSLLLGPIRSENRFAYLRAVESPPGVGPIGAAASGIGTRSSAIGDQRKASMLPVRLSDADMTFAAIDTFQER